MIVYIYAVISFVFLHEFFDVNDGLFCRTLGECVVTVIREGLLDTLGAVRQKIIRSGALSLSCMSTEAFVFYECLRASYRYNTGRVQVLESDAEPRVGICRESLLFTIYIPVMYVYVHVCMHGYMDAGMYP